MLDDILPSIRKLSRSESLSTAETRRTLNTLMDEDDEYYFTIAFSMGLMAKTPTVDELKGFVLSFEDRSIPLRPSIDTDKLIDISGTGGDDIKTPNIGTTASFVMAAGGLFVGKQSTRGYTGATGSRDMFTALGIDVPMSGGDPQSVEKGLEDNHLFPFYYPSFSDAFENRVGFFTKLKEAGLTFVTPWHLASWVHSPLDLRYRVYGMLTDDYLEDFAHLFREIGYEHVLVVHGLDGIDEVSNVGKTKISELRGGNVETYTLSPSDLGVSESSIDEITSGGADQNVIDFVRIIYNRDTGAKRDLVAINAGAAFYTANVTSSIEEGTEYAFDIIESGDAARKLEQLVEYAGDPDELEDLKSKL